MNPTHSIRNFVFSVFKEKISDKDAAKIFLKFSKSRSYGLRELEEAAAKFLRIRKYN